MDGVMCAVAKDNTPWKEDVYFDMKGAQQKLSKWYAEVTLTTGMLLTLAHIPDSFHMLLSWRKLDKGMHMNPQDETSYTTQYQQAFLMYVENEHCARHRRVPVIKP